jgi:hypothetical protein
MSGCGARVDLATGSVVDQNGKMVDAARVVFQNDDLYMVHFTDEGGHYVLEDLAAGSYVVSATADGCEDGSHDYVYEGGDVEMDIALICSE